MDRSEFTKLLASKNANALASLLGNVFASVDDTFFKMAEGAKTNADQNLYFDAMRQLRLSREPIEVRFKQSYQSTFFEALSGKFHLSGSSEVIAQSDPQSLSLVKNEDLETLVALTSLVKKIRHQCSEPLLMLTHRLNALYKPVAIDESNNPLDPEIIAHVFKRALETCEFDIKTLLIVFKVFEKVLSAQLSEVIERMNDRLIKANVLPNLQIHQITGPILATYPVSGKKALALPAQDQQVFNQLRDFLGKVEQLSHAHTDQMQELPQQELMAKLTDVDKKYFEVMVDPYKKIQLDIRSALKAIVVRQNGAPQAIRKIDDDVIKLITKLFEYILDDKNLPLHMQALLSRLQIPILRVAVADQGFFNKADHPARRLLNVLARAGIGWNEVVEVDKDPVYRKIQDTVMAIKNEFNGDVKIFAQALESFERFMSKEDQKSDVIEQRTRESEEGLARSQNARSRVHTVLNERIRNQNLPKEVVAFLLNAWSNVMFLSCLKSGENSQDWQDELATAEELIWSVQALDPQYIEQWKAMLPTMATTIKHGLKKVSYSQHEVTQWFTDLSRIHKMRLQEAEALLAQQAQDTQPQSVVPDQPDVIEAQVGASTQSSAHKESSRQEPVILEQLIDEQDIPLLSEPKARSAFESEATPVTLVPAKEAHARQANIATSDHVDIAPYLEQVSEISVGDWLEFEQVDGSLVRCKLSAIIAVTDMFIFVSRKGVKVAEKNRRELAHDMKRGRVKVLDKGQVFERALGKLFGSLKN